MSNLSLGMTQPTTTSQATPIGGGGGDKYAALASLDEIFKGIQPKEEGIQREKQTLQQPEQLQQQQVSNISIICVILLAFKCNRLRA